MKSIAIFASGTGTNAEQIIKHFSDDSEVNVALVVTNSAEAGVVDVAKKYSVPLIIISRAEFYGEQKILEELERANVELIVLAGFLWLIPEYLIRAYRGRIINIHPSLLPKFGGKGMYGKHVHQAVIAAREKESGITIHYVDEEFDKGEIIFQARCSVDVHDTPETLAKKVQKLEHEYFPKMVEKVIREI